MGKSLAEFKRHASDLRSEFESGLDDPEDEKPAPPAVAEKPASPATVTEKPGAEKAGPDPDEPVEDERPAPKPAGDESPA